MLSYDMVLPVHNPPPPRTRPVAHTAQQHSLGHRPVCRMPGPFPRPPPHHNPRRRSRGFCARFSSGVSERVPHSPRAESRHLKSRPHQHFPPCGTRRVRSGSGLRPRVGDVPSAGHSGQVCGLGPSGQGCPLVSAAAQPGPEGGVRCRTVWDPPPPGVTACTPPASECTGTPDALLGGLDRRLEEVAKAVGGGYCRLQVPLTLALGARETVAGHRLGALEAGGGWGTSPLPIHSTPPPLASTAPLVSAAGGAAALSFRAATAVLARGRGVVVVAAGVSTSLPPMPHQRSSVVGLKGRHWGKGPKAQGWGGFWGLLLVLFRGPSRPPPPPPHGRAPSGVTVRQPPAPVAYSPTAAGLGTHICRWRCGPFFFVLRDSRPPPIWSRRIALDPLPLATDGGWRSTDITGGVGD